MVRRLRRHAACLGMALLSLGGAACAQPSTRPAEHPFLTIVMLPDTQHYSRKWPESFLAQTEGVRRNRDRENIVFVTHVGDVVNDRNKDMNEWDAADRAMSRLDGVVPWGTALGNHDFALSKDGTRDASGFLQHFGPQRFKGLPWYGGASANGLNSYQLFSGAGMDFIILHLEMEAPDSSIAWAAEVLRQHPHRAAIVTTHSYLKGHDGVGRSIEKGKGEGLNSGEEIWCKLIRNHPQIFMVLCGHVQATVEYHQVSINDAGNKVAEILADYQRRHNGGDGWLRMIRIVPAAGEIQVRTYSPVLDEFETDSDSQFVVPFELPAACRTGAVPAAR
ncbi:MAG TPA: metallophosphoesterase [Phycisphaerae bacterium]|nr:metallophosphoesterase [Phycisphaerae bacterium]